MVESLQFPDVTYVPLKEQIDEKKVALMEEGEEFGEQTSFTQQDVQRSKKQVRDQYIKKLYEQTDMSQRDLAEEEGLSRSRIHEIVSAA